MHCCRQVYLPNAAPKLGITRISGILFAGVGSLGGEFTGEHGGEGGSRPFYSRRLRSFCLEDNENAVWGRSRLTPGVRALCPVSGIRFY